MSLYGVFQSLLCDADSIEQFSTLASKDGKDGRELGPTQRNSLEKKGQWDP